MIVKVVWTIDEGECSAYYSEFLLSFFLQFSKGGDIENKNETTGVVRDKQRRTSYCIIIKGGESRKIRVKHDKALLSNACSNQRNFDASYSFL